MKNKLILKKAIAYVMAAITFMSGTNITAFAKSVDTEPVVVDTTKETPEVIVEDAESFAVLKDGKSLNSLFRIMAGDEDMSVPNTTIKGIKIVSSPIGDAQGYSLAEKGNIVGYFIPEETEEDKAEESKTPAEESSASEAPKTEESAPSKEESVPAKEEQSTPADNSSAAETESKPQEESSTAPVEENQESSPSASENKSKAESESNVENESTGNTEEKTESSVVEDKTPAPETNESKPVEEEQSGTPAAEEPSAPAETPSSPEAENNETQVPDEKVTEEPANESSVKSTDDTAFVPLFPSAGEESKPEEEKEKKPVIGYIFIYSDQTIQYNKDTSEIFKNMEILEDISDLSKISFKEVEKANEMFAGDKKLKDIHALVAYRPEKLKEANKMFYGCSELESPEFVTPTDIYKLVEKEKPDTKEKYKEQSLSYTSWQVKEETEVKEMFAGTKVKEAEYPDWYVAAEAYRIAKEEAEKKAAEEAAKAAEEAAKQESSEQPEENKDNQTEGNETEVKSDEAKSSSEPEKPVYEGNTAITMNGWGAGISAGAANVFESERGTLYANGDTFKVTGDHTAETSYKGKATVNIYYGWIKLTTVSISHADGTVEEIKDVYYGEDFEIDLSDVTAINIEVGQVEANDPNLEAVEENAVEEVPFQNIPALRNAIVGPKLLASPLRSSSTDSSASRVNGEVGSSTTITNRFPTYHLGASRDNNTGNDLYCISALSNTPQTGMTYYYFSVEDYCWINGKSINPLVAEYLGYNYWIALHGPIQVGDKTYGATWPYPSYTEEDYRGREYGIATFTACTVWMFVGDTPQGYTPTMLADAQDFLSHAYAYAANYPDGKKPEKWSRETIQVLTVNSDGTKGSYQPLLAFGPPQGDPEPWADLVILKTSDKPDQVDGTKYSLAGAVFEVYSSASCNESSYLATLTTDTEGRTPPLRLEAPKTYYVKEITPNKGHRIKVKEAQAISLEMGGEEQTITFENELIEIIGSVQIQKSSSNPDLSNTNPVKYTLEGAVFGIYKTKVDDHTATDLIGKITTDATGLTDKFEFADDQAGTYYVQEITPPEYYERDDTVREIVINGSVNSDHLLSIPNEPTVIPPNITIYKSSAAPEITDNDPYYSLKGAVYGIYKDVPGKTVEEIVADPKNKVSEVTTDVKGKTPKTEVDPGNYIVYEIFPSKHYMVPDPRYQRVQVNYEEAVDVSFLEPPEEKPKYGNLRIEKKSTSEDVSKGDGHYSRSGAVFEIYSEETGKLVGTLPTDASGKTEMLTGLPIGNYLVKEITAPPGFKLDPGPYTVTVSEDLLVSYQYQDVPYPKGTVEIYKYDSTYGTALADAEFSIYKKIGEEWVFLKKMTSRGDGHYVSGMLYGDEENPDGIFKIVETNVPTNHTGSFEKIYTFSSENVIEYYDRVSNDPLPTKVWVQKVDRDTGAILDGGNPATAAIFYLYEYNIETGEYNDPITMTWDAEKQMYGYTVHVREENGGFFRIEEVEAPAQYRTEYIEDFQVTSGSPAEMIFTAKDRLLHEKGRIAIHKVNSAVPSENIGDGATFKVYQWDQEAGAWDMDNIYDTLVYNGLTGNYESTMDYYRYDRDTDPSYNMGKYKVVEEKAPSGFINNLNWSKEFEIPADGDYDTIHFFTEQSGAAVAGKVYSSITVPNLENKFEIIKVKGDGTTPLPGVVFRITNTTTGYVFPLNETTTDASGKVTLTRLAAGKYMYVEESVPTGFDIDVTKRYFEVTEDGRVNGELADSETVINYPVTDLIIIKKEQKAGQAAVEATSSNPIYSFTGENSFPDGAEFTIYEAVSVTGGVPTYSVTPYAVAYNSPTGFIDIKTGNVVKLKYKESNLGWYKIVETKWPDGYIHNETSTEIQLPAEGNLATMEVTFTNEPNKYTINKVNENGQPMTDAVSFRIWKGNIDNPDFEITMQTTNGKIEMERIPEGTWYYQETATIGGYGLTPTIGSFTVDSDGKIDGAVTGSDTVKNYPTTTVIITKVDSLTGRQSDTESGFPDGTEFKVYEWDKDKSDYKDDPYATIIYKDGQPIPTSSLDPLFPNAGKEDEEEKTETPQEIANRTLFVYTENKKDIPSYAEILTSVGNVYLIRFETAEKAEEWYSHSRDLHAYVAYDDMIYTADEAEPEAEPNVYDADNNPLKEYTTTARITGNFDVALIDTGVSGNLAAMKVSMLGDEGEDVNGHGTEMAKLILAQNPDARILSIKAMSDNGVGSISSIYAAIKYAIAAGVKVINLSVSSYSPSGVDVIEQIIKEATEAGILVVGAAGNANMDVRNFVPGSIRSAVIVSACDENGNELESTNFGSGVDYAIVAPNTSSAAAIVSGYASKMETYTKQELHDAVMGEEENIFYPSLKDQGVTYTELLENVFETALDPPANSWDQAIRIGNCGGNVGMVNQWTYARLRYWFQNQNSSAKTIQVKVAFDLFYVDSDGVGPYSLDNSTSFRVYAGTNDTTVYPTTVVNFSAGGNGSSAGSQQWLNLFESGWATCNYSASGSTGSITIHLYGYNGTGISIFEKDNTGTSHTIEDSGTRTFTHISSVTVTTSAGTGGSVSPSGATTKNPGDSFSATATASTGYKFTGWTFGGGWAGQSAVSTATFTKTVPDSNATATASFAKQKYTLTTSAGTGGTASGGGTFEYNTAHTITATPGTGYDFSKWTKGGSGSIANVNSASTTFTMGAGNGTATASFTPHTYSISYSLAGGSYGTYHPTSGTYNSVVTISNPTRTGYTFAGWTVTGVQSGATQGTTNNPTTAISNGATKVKSTTFKNLRYDKGNTVVFTATWTINSYALTVTANPTAGGTVSGGGTFNYNSAHTITATAKTGYHFTGWTKGGQGSIANTGNASTTFTMGAGAGSATAGFALNTGTVYYYGNGQTGKGSDTGATIDSTGKSNRTSGVTYGTNIGTGGLYDVATLFSKTGYHIDNADAWRVGTTTSTTYLAQNVNYTGQQVISTLSTGHNRTQNLYANWKANSYSIKYNINTPSDSTGSGTMANTAATYDQNVTLRGNGFSVVGYDFLGWATTATATSAAYTNGQTITKPNFTSTNGGTYNLYAVWKKHVYTDTQNHVMSGFQNGEGNYGTGNVEWKLSTANTFTQLFKGSITFGTGAYTNGTDTTKASGAPGRVALPRGYQLRTSGARSYETNRDGNDYVAGNALPWTTTQPAKNFTTIYRYDPISYNITYNLNGGNDDHGSPTTYNVLYGNQFGTPTKNNYAFRGWTLSDESLRAQFEAGVTIGANGALGTGTQADVATKGAIPINASSEFRMNKNVTAYYYTSNGTFINSASGTSFVSPAGAAYVRFSTNATNLNGLTSTDLFVRGVNTGKNATFTSETNMLNDLNGRMIGNVTLNANWEQTGKTVLVSVVNDNGSMVGDTELQLIDENGNILDQWVSSASAPYAGNGHGDGTDLAHLPVGKYIIREVRANSEYEPNLQDTVIIVPADSTTNGNAAVNTMTVPILVHHVKDVSFVDEATEQFLVLIQSEQNEGKFKIEEVKSTPGYIMDSSIAEVDLVNKKIKYDNGAEETLTISADHKINVNFSNTPNKYTIIKHDDEGNILPGAYFNVWKDNDIAHAVEHMTGPEGRIDLYRLAPGTWYYRETQAPDGYRMDENIYSFTVNENGYIIGSNGSLVLEDSKIVINIPEDKAYATIKKVDQNGAAVPNITFRISYPNGNVEEKVTDASGTILLGPLTIDGTYTYQEVITETQMANGFVADTSPKTFVKDGTNITYNNNGGVVMNSINSFKIVKYAGATGNRPLPGVKFTLTNGTKTYTLTSGANGETEAVYGLASGTWTLTEIKTINGYTLDNAPTTFTVAADGTINGVTAFTATKRNNMASVVIQKLTAEGDVGIEGAQIHIWSTDTNKSTYDRVLTTDAGGYVEIIGILDGSYAYQEVVPPKGYLLDDTVRYFTVSAGSVTPETLNIRDVSNKVTIVKVDADGNPLPGITLKITGPDSFEETFITTSSGTKEFTALAPGNYVVEETASDGVHVLTDQKITFIVNQDGTITSTVTDDKDKIAVSGTPEAMTFTISNFKYTTTDFTLYKKDASNLAVMLDGAVFVMEYWDGEEWKPYKTFTDNGDGSYTVDEVSPTISQDRRFRVRETSAPDGYYGYYERVFTIDNLYEDNNHFVWDVTNEKNRIVIEKVEIDHEGNLVLDDNGQPKKLADAEFAVTIDGVPYLVGGENPTTDADGRLVIDGIGNGERDITITVHEEFIPGRFHIDDTTYNFTVNKLGEITLNNPNIYSKESAGQTKVVSENGTIKLVVGNDRNVPVLGRVEIIKRNAEDSNEILKDAEFEIYEWDKDLNDGAGGYKSEPYKGEGSDHSMIYTEDNDHETGYYINTKILEYTIYNLGKFKVVETKAPDGFQAEFEEELTLDVSEHGLHRFNLVAEDDPNRLILHKVNEEDEPLENVTFELRPADMDNVLLVERYNKQFTTDDQGNAYIDRLIPGIYYIKEVKTASGYALDTTERKIIVDGHSLIYEENDGVNKSDAYQMEFLNKKNKIAIYKINELQQPLAGVEFTLRYYEWGLDNDPTRVESKLTDTDGKVEFTNLADGLYKFEETRELDGYINKHIQYQFMVQDGLIMKEYGSVGQQYFEWPIKIVNSHVDDAKYARIYLEKKDSETGAFLPGATFVAIPFSTSKGDFDPETQFEFTDNGDGTYTSPQLLIDGTTDYGRYVVIETKSPDGYVAAHDGVSFLKEIQFEYNTATREYSDYYITGDDAVLNDPSKITILKVDEEDPSIKLQDATFELYDVTADQLVGEATTDENGIAEFTGLHNNHTYKLYETEAPNGYTFDYKEWEINVGQSGLRIEITITNYEAKEIGVTKAIRADEIEYANGVPSFIFKLTGQDKRGNEVEKYLAMEFTEDYVRRHTDDDGYVRISDKFTMLRSGDYTVQEVPVARYVFEKITNVENGTIVGQTIDFDLNTYSYGEGMFTNKKGPSDELSDTNIVINKIGPEEEREVQTYNIVYKPGYYGVGTTPANQVKTEGVDIALSSQTFTHKEDGVLATVTFDSDGGSNSPSPLTSVATYRQTGWSETQEGEADYILGETFQENDGLILYPSWEKTISGVTLPDPGTKEGAVFDGWFHGNTRVGWAGDVIYPIGDIHLTAWWSNQNVD